jgi:DNA ligase-1
MKYQDEPPIINHYPKLYTKDSLGNIRTWKMEQNGDAYRTHSGIKNGQIVVSEWTKAEPKNTGKKNETTGEQQATVEIQAKYKKQLKTGYVEHEHEVENDSKYVEPMLAKLYKDYADKIDFTKKEWLMQCKFNGMRCIATKNGLFTRKGEKYESVPHVENALKPFFDKNPDAVLDGELFNNELRQQLNEISKLIRKTVHITDEDLKQSEKLVKYYIYDGYGFNSSTYSFDEGTAYTIRKSWIDGNVVGEYKYVEGVKDIYISNQQEMDNAYQTLVDDNQEGGILRLKNMPYEHKRSKNLLKVKPEDDQEGVIVDIKEGTGNWSGTGKVITLNWQGKTFDATFKGTYEEAVEFLKNKQKMIGKTVTFLYNGLTGLGTPNYARVDINNCFKEDR